MESPKKSKAEDTAARVIHANSRKALFLKAIEEHGTILSACRVTNIPRGTYNTWQQTDPDFVSALGYSRMSFAESLEDLALSRVRNPDKNRGSDILLIGLLNANMPQKYRPQIAMSEDSAKDLIHEWRKAQQEVKKGTPAEAVEIPADAEKTLAEILEKRSHGKDEKVSSGADEDEE
jgi:hypothetical protein